jgi:DNA-directed RNA polymerase subunit M/transcription elongation factor TFIIS
MKKFIKIISFVLSLAVILCCVGCAGDANSDTASVENSSVSASDTQSEVTSSNTESETTSSDTVSRQPTQEQLNCSHEYTSSITKYPRVLDEGETTYMCKLCEYSYIEKIPKTKTLKVLALGNSFSCDAMEYLWDIADNAGVENIVLGNINISACSLDMYLEYIWDDSTHNYRKNTDGTWKDRTFTVADVLADEE